MGILEQQSGKDKIISLRGQDVILDFAVAEIYGEETREINQAVLNFAVLKLRHSVKRERGEK